MDNGAVYDPPTSSSRGRESAFFQNNINKSLHASTIRFLGHTDDGALVTSVERYAQRSAGIILPRLKHFGGQFQIAHDLAVLLPPELVPLSTVASGHPSDFFRDEDSKMAFTFVTHFKFPPRLVTDFDREATNVFPAPATTDDGDPPLLLDSAVFKLLCQILKIPKQGSSFSLHSLVCDLPEDSLLTLASTLNIDVPEAFAFSNGLSDSPVLKEFCLQITAVMANQMKLQSTAPKTKPAGSPPASSPSPGDDSRYELAQRRSASSTTDSQLRMELICECNSRLAILHAHFPVTILALRATGVFPAKFASIDSLPTALLHAVKRYLMTEDYIQALFLNAATIDLPHGATVSQRAQRLISEPDLLTSTAYKSSLSPLLYEGTPFERVFGLLPRGCIAATLAMKHYIGTPSPLVNNLYATARDLQFGDSAGRLRVSEPIEKLTAALHSVDGPEIKFTIASVFIPLVDSMERFGPSFDPVWNKLLLESLTQRNAARLQDTIPGITSRTSLRSLTPCLPPSSCLMLIAWVPGHTYQQHTR